MNAEPSWNLTPSLRVKERSLPSSLQLHSVARIVLDECVENVVVEAVSSLLRAERRVQSCEVTTLAVDDFGLIFARIAALFVVVGAGAHGNCHSRRQDEA